MEQLTESRLLDLPTEILVAIVELLDVQSLVDFAQTCRAASDLASTFAWPSYLRRHPRLNPSLEKAHSGWSAKRQILFNTRADKAWQDGRFSAQTLRPTAWPHKLHPVMAISCTRLAVGAGHMIYTFLFPTSPELLRKSPYITEHTLSIHPSSNSRDGRLDITGLVFLPDGGADRTLCVSCVNGSIIRVELPRGRQSPASIVRTAIYQQPNPDQGVVSLSFQNSKALAFSSTGLATLFSPSSPWLPHSTLQIQTNHGWTTHLSDDGSKAAFGMNAINPVSVHSVLPTGLSTEPLVTLASKETGTRPTSVFSLGSFPEDPSGQILVSGWYDGKVRVYDLRVGSGIAGLRPVLSLYDSIRIEDGFYSVSCGGGSSNHITAGSARHSVVCTWDIRHPPQAAQVARAKAGGWSIFAPLRDNSPVYSLISEGSRIWGCTQSHPFLLDFCHSDKEPRCPWYYDQKAPYAAVHF